MASVMDEKKSEGKGGDGLPPPYAYVAVPTQEQPQQPAPGGEHDEPYEPRAHASYFSSIARRSSAHRRTVTLVYVVLAGFCYYLLFGGQLPSISIPDELKLGSLRGYGYGRDKNVVDRLGHWISDKGRWIMGHKSGGCGGRFSHSYHADSPQARDRANLKGYMAYVAHSSGLELHAPGMPASKAASDAYLGASRGGSAFGNQLDTSVSTATLSGSSLSQVWQSVFLSSLSNDSLSDTLRKYTNRTHVAGTSDDRQTALYTAKRWSELLLDEEDQPRRIKDIVYEAGSQKSRNAVTGAGEHGRHGKKHRHGRHLRGDASAQRRHHGPKPRVFVDTYHVWLNHPINQSLFLSAKPTEEDPNPAPSFTASLVEDQVGDDPSIPADVVPTFHGYSKSGSIKYAPVVYANLGNRDDFEALEKAGVPVKGAIALVRYGGAFRGLKVQNAADYGAVGCLIYTDPAEDGAVTTANGHEAYPTGPARQPSSLQRGSVQLLSVYPGDPSTPGKPSYKNATRLQPEKAKSLPSIPSLPVSYRDALPILKSLEGKGQLAGGLGPNWKQGNDSSHLAGYWTGPNPDVVASMANFGDLKVRKIYNTYAVIPGYTKETLIVGNHHDAWTFGAADPNSGSAVFVELAKALGVMVKKGWRPLRTIMLASWDAEEYGLVGSTEFAEDYAEWIQENVAAYINVDVAVAGGALKGAASPSLDDLFVEVAGQVDSPDAPQGTNQKLQFPRGNPLGSGSDYTSFLQHLGIASVDLGFTRRRTDPVYHYHSQYDSFAWMDSYGDPGFHRHLALAKVFGVASLTAASNLFVPINVTAYAHELSKYVDKAESLAQKLEEPRPDFGPLRTGVEQITLSAQRIDVAKQHLAEKLNKILHDYSSQNEKAAQEHLAELAREAAREAQTAQTGSKPTRGRSSSHKGKHGKHDDKKKKHHHHDVHRQLREVIRQIFEINTKSRKFEAGFISQDGLVGRPFYRHLATAPGRHLGYGATTLPGVTESITLDGGKGTQQEIDRLAKLMENVAQGLQIPVHMLQR